MAPAALSGRSVCLCGRLRGAPGGAVGRGGAKVVGKGSGAGSLFGKLGYHIVDNDLRGIQALEISGGSVCKTLRISASVGAARHRSECIYLLTN